MPLLSIIVPCYKKGKVVYSAVADIYKVANTLAIPFELVLVDDGSSDNTLDELRRFKKGHANCKIVRMKRNMGKGRAVFAGFKHSKGDLVMFIDADRDLPPRQMRLFLDYLERYRADAVIGSKNHPDSIVRYPILRRLLSRAYQIMCFILFQWPISDSQVGIKLFRRPVLEYVAPRVLVKKFAFDLEMLVLAYYKGFHIREVPVELKFRSGTGAGMLRSVFNIWLDTMAVWYRLKVLHYYDKAALKQSNGSKK